MSMYDSEAAPIPSAQDDTPYPVNPDIPMPFYLTRRGLAVTDPPVAMSLEGYAALHPEYERVFTLLATERPWWLR